MLTSLLTSTLTNTVLIAGQVITVGVDDIINSGKSDDPIKYVAGISQSDERGGYDVYHGE